MSNPALLNHRVHNPMRTVFDEMRAVHENYTGITVSRRADFFCAIPNEGLSLRGARRWSGCRVDKYLLDGAEAAALSQRMDFQPLEIQRFGCGAHFCEVLPR